MNEDKNLWKCKGCGKDIAAIEPNVCCECRYGKGAPVSKAKDMLEHDCYIRQQTQWGARLIQGLHQMTLN